MNIKEKLLNLKKLLTMENLYIATIITTMGIISIGGYYKNRQILALKQLVENQYNRSFYDMVAHVNNVEMLMAKSLVTSTPIKTALILQEAWRQANLAQTSLGQLPIAQPVLANTAKFLNQIGDLSYSLNNQNIDGKYFTDTQYKILQNLHSFSISLENSLSKLESDILAGELKWGELTSKGTPIFMQTSDNLPKVNFENLDKTFKEYPKLIYDGPFSEHITSMQPKFTNEPLITVEQGKDIVSNFFGSDKISNISNSSKNDNASVKTFTYNVTFKNTSVQNTATVEVTQNGGHVLWMIYNRPVTNSTLNIEQAKSQGKKFLEDHGYKNMSDTYYLNENNVATINYAYRTNNITMYPDLIKIKVGLDNGEILGFEGKRYLVSHTERNIPTPKLTEKQARALISNKVGILSSGMAVIPTDYNTELLTYEFKGKLDSTDFIIYVNANTGKEEDILMIVNTPNGILTM